jgi:hypothetical protein
VPLYVLSWREGCWRPLGAAAPSPSSLKLELAELWAMGDQPIAAEPALDEAQLARERARFLVEARSRAAALLKRWRQAPPAWNRPTGQPEVDDLVWFRYVETEGL